MAIATGTALLASAAIGGGTALIGGAMQSRAANQTAQAATNAANQTDATNRYIFDTIRNDNAQGRAIGNAASATMAQLLGLNFQSQPNALSGGAMGQGRAYPGLQRQNGPVGEGGPQINPGLPGGQSTAAQPTSGAGNALNPTDWLRSTPGYEFNFSEGLRGMNLALANRGQLLSGDAAREAQRYGQNYADRIYGDQWNRLAGLAGYGQTASSNTQQAGQAYASGTANNAWNRAGALGSSYQNGANAWTNALGGVAGAGLWAMNNYGGGNAIGNALSNYRGMLN